VLTANARSPIKFASLKLPRGLVSSAQSCERSCCLQQKLQKFNRCPVCISKTPSFEAHQLPVQHVGLNLSVASSSTFTQHDASLPTAHMPTMAEKYTMRKRVRSSSLEVFSILTLPLLLSVCVQPSMPLVPAHPGPFPQWHMPFVFSEVPQPGGHSHESAQHPLNASGAEPSPHFAVGPGGGGGGGRGGCRY
jgi:hypothetical protein